ncbi:MAG: hypothetical protein ACOZAO_02290 [Patescibacteria group bacterium]
MNEQHLFQQLHNFFTNVSQNNDAGLEKYLQKFIPSDLEPKDECCLKYCERPNGRYCHTCPNHPLRSSNINFLHPKYVEASELINKKDYVMYIMFLYVNNLPYPRVSELYEVILSS